MGTGKTMDDMRTAEYFRQIILALKYLRIRSNVTQEEFYEQTGIHIGRVEAGKSNLTLLTVMRICRYYKITPKELFDLAENISL